MPRVQDRIVPTLRLQLRADSILRVHQVAAILGLSPRMVRHLALHDKLRGYKTGPRLWAFRGSDVQAYLRIMLRDWEFKCLPRMPRQTISVGADVTASAPTIPVRVIPSIRRCDRG